MGKQTDIVTKTLLSTIILSGFAGKIIRNKKKKDKKQNM